MRIYTYVEKVEGEMFGDGAGFNRAAGIGSEGARTGWQRGELMMNNVE